MPSPGVPDEVVKLIQREHAAKGSPYLVSISGGVAAGKSWTAARLQELLARQPGLHVEVVGSDGFLFSNEDLEARGLSARKGFPETYDRRKLVTFLTAIRAADPDATAPRYSHLTYDVVDGPGRPVGLPDIVLVEGLGLLRVEPGDDVGELFDLSIYLDAEEGDLETWFVERFRFLLREGASDPSSFFHRFAGLGEQGADELAHAVWRSVNAVNLHHHIRPGRDRARVVIQKGPDHAVRSVEIRE